MSQIGGGYFVQKRNFSIGIFCADFFYRDLLCQSDFFIGIYFELKGVFWGFIAPKWIIQWGSIVLRKFFYWNPLCRREFFYWDLLWQREIFYVCAEELFLLGSFVPKEFFYWDLFKGFFLFGSIVPKIIFYWDLLCQMDISIGI